MLLFSEIPQVPERFVRKSRMFHNCGRFWEDAECNFCVKRESSLMLSWEVLYAIRDSQVINGIWVERLVESFARGPVELDYKRESRLGKELVFFSACRNNLASTSGFKTMASVLVWETWSAQ